MHKIMIVEDEPMILDLYKVVFEDQGYEVVAVTDSELALKTVRDQRPDVVLLDIMMPKLDGIEVLKQLKADVDIKHIPVFMLTNVSADIMKNQALGEGAAGYIIKTEMSAEEVLTEIKSYLEPVA